MNQSDIMIEERRLKAVKSLSILDTAPEERFDRLTRMAKKIFGVPAALVSLVDANRIWYKSSMGMEIRESPRENSFCGHAILGDDVFTVPDTFLDERFAPNKETNTDEPCIRFYAGCPLRTLDGSKLGTLCLVDFNPRGFDEIEMETLRDLASMVERELAALQLATQDELTGVANRRGLIAHTKQLLNLCERQKFPVTLIFFDLVKFKFINDNFGHAEGDRALVVFSEQLKLVARDSDLLGRIGGDEFVAVLTNSSKDFALEIIERFNRGLNKYNAKANRGYNITFSFGAVEFDSDRHNTIEDLLAECDEEMYRHKKEG